MIQIKEITIRNYRSIKEVQLRMKNFLTLVGHNNAGKSNCLKAIRWALSLEKPSKSDYHHDNKPEIEFTLSGVTSETLDLILKESNKAAKKKIQDMVCNDEIRLKYETIEKEGGKVDFSIFYFMDSEWQTPGTGINNALKPILPDVFTIQAMTDSSEQTSKMKSGSLFYKLLADYCSSEIDPELKTEISTILEKLKNDPSLVELSRKVNQTLSQYYNNFNANFTADFSEQDIYKTFRLRIKENDCEFDLSDYGHGLQRSTEFAMLECVVNQSGKHSALKSTVLLIDEPEIYQHPSIVNRIRKNLRNLSENGFQIALTTHSPNMIRDKTILENTYIIYADAVNGTSLRNKSKDSNLDKVNEKAFSMFLSLDQLSYIPFCETVLLYEGDTESLIFSELFSDILPESSYKLHHFQTSTCNQLPFVAKILQQFGVPAYLLGDLDTIKTKNFVTQRQEELIVEAQKFAKTYFSTIEGCKLENGWPANDKKNGITAAGTFAKLHLAPDFETKFNPLLLELEKEHLLLWHHGDIEHTLYPTLMKSDKDKTEYAHKVIETKNDNLSAGGVIEAWKKTIQDFGGDWNALVRFVRIVVGDIATKAEMDRLNHSLDIS